jgi:hypothetical protein
MDAHEQKLAVSVDARPSGQLAERAWVRAWAEACMPHPWSIHKGFAARAAESLGTCSHYQMPARARMRVNSNRTARTAPIQYP